VTPTYSDIKARYLAYCDVAKKHVMIAEQDGVWHRCAQVVMVSTSGYYGGANKYGAIKRVILMLFEFVIIGKPVLA